MQINNVQKGYQLAKKGIKPGCFLTAIAGEVSEATQNPKPNNLEKMQFRQNALQKHSIETCLSMVFFFLSLFENVHCSQLETASKKKSK